MNLVRLSRSIACLNNRTLARVVSLALVCAALACAQLPRSFYQWWNSPVRKDLNLSLEQERHIRTTIQTYRGHLIDLRGEIEKAEGDLEFQFEQEPVDLKKAHEAIARLATARGELTKTLSEMSLQLRTVLTQQQWQELQKRRPTNGK